MRTAARYFVAFFMLAYGFAKLNGSQFTILDSELDRPMGEVSGFWLTWYYFGYSRAYGTLVALAEIGGGLLLLSRRTTLLGALVLLPVMLNVVLVDVFFGIDLGALLMALLLTAGLLVILAPHAAALWEAVYTRPARLAAERPLSRGRTAGWGALCVAMVAVTAGLTYWTANVNNISPTPLDGTWRVVERPVGLAGAQVPSTIYFERNRAHMAVFRYADREQTHHFEVDPARQSLRVWRDWLSRGPQLFDGAYELRGDRLRITGRVAGQPQPATLVLERRRVAGSRGISPRRARLADAGPGGSAP